MSEKRAASPERERLEASIARHRKEFGDAVGTLKDVALQDVVPEAVGLVVSKNPYAWLAGAFLVGTWLGSLHAD